MHTVRSKEQRDWNQDAGNGDSITIYSQPPDAASAREVVFTMNMRPAATGAYASGTMAPDWKNKRIYYTYIDDPNGFSGTPATVMKWWDGKSNGVSPGTAVTTLAGFWLDSFAMDPDNEHIYFVGHDDPYPTYAADWSVDLKRMDYDGSNVTTLDTIDVFRTGGSIASSGIGSLLVHRQQQRLYYVKRHNIGTSTASDWVIELCYRDFADMATEFVIYSVVCFTGLGAATDIRAINCLSFDIDRGKIYWCEHYQDGDLLGKVRRADLDGSNVELLYDSAATYAVNFARYSNTLKKIVHEDFELSAPNDGYYLRDLDFSVIEQYGKVLSPETYSSPFPGPNSSYLWCGFENTGSGVKP